MCVLSIKVPIRKKSGNLSYAPRIYIYIYIYVYVYISGGHSSSYNIYIYIYIYIPRMEWRPTLHRGIGAIEKGAFGSLSSKVTNFTFFIYIYIHMYI